jgi:hypothetical protein
MEIKKISLAVIGLCGVYATSAVAIEPASISSGPVAVIPQMAVQVGHDDNIFSDESGAVGSLITLLKPSVQLVMEKENDAYRLTYALEEGIYQDSSADNYTDHSLVAEAIMELNSRNRLDLSATYLKEHEDRGTTDSADLGSPDLYTDKAVSGTYRYGAENAAGNVELAASFLNHEFDAQANAGRDRDNTRVGATFFYRVAPKTSALFELRQENIDYDQASSTLDNTERKYLAGVKWDATAKTSGTAKLGYAEKEFDSASREDQDGVSWELGARWSPRTYSTFDLNTSQEFEESSGTGDAIDTTNLNLTWTHGWNDRVSTNAMLGRMNEEYVGNGANGREDETNTVMLGVNYELQRWLSANLAYTNTDTQSNIAGESFDRNKVMLTLTGSL